MISSAVLAVSTCCITAFAADGSIKIDPQYSEFNKNDVNGGIVVELEGNISAKTKITLDSPEESGAVYYDQQLDSSKGRSFTFDLEGYDNIADGNTLKDGRFYNFSIAVTDKKTGMSSDEYSDSKLTVPDVDNNPSSEIRYVYHVKAVSDSSEENFSAAKKSVKDGITYIEKDIALYPGEKFTKGDVNSDGIIDSSDASLVLKNYADISTGHADSFTGSQKSSADVNEDGTTDSSDASKILKYYADESTGKTPTWN